MIYKVRYFFAALFVLLAGLAAICHNEALLQVSLRALGAVCAGISEPASPSIASWQPSLTQANIQQTAGRLSVTLTVSSSAPCDTGDLGETTALNQSPYSGFWSSNKEEHLTFTCSLTSRYPGKLWLNGGSRLLAVAMTDTCRQELESKLCTMAATGPLAMPQSTLQRLSRRKSRQTSLNADVFGEFTGIGDAWQLPYSFPWIS